MSVKLTIEWDRFGKLSHSVNSHHVRDLLFVSLPMLYSHQLGSYNINHGIVLLKNAFDYFVDGNHSLLPINGDLKRATIEFVPKSNSQFVIRFLPKHRLFANSDSVEEGSRQLLNNYTDYVTSRYEELNRMTLVTSFYLVFETYKQIVESLIENKYLSSNKLWDLRLPRGMANLTLDISSQTHVHWWDDMKEVQINDAKKKLFDSGYKLRREFSEFRNRILNI